MVHTAFIKLSFANKLCIFCDICLFLTGSAEIPCVRAISLFTGRNGFSSEIITEVFRYVQTRVLYLPYSGRTEET
jgi:hypothetical protein